MSSMKYRPDIDGLRTLAVIPVLLFHAGVSWFNGGYIGVDIFFVISGFLITSIILWEINKGSFSLVDFYQRRIRRIIPALLLVITVTIPFSLYFLSSADFDKYLVSIVASIFFVSNFTFWRDSGYFDSGADEKPLLHTWSLGVEEQYYLVFPLLMLLLWREKTRFIVVGIILIGILSSFFLSLWAGGISPDAAFYLSPFRVWEILVGALAAIIIDKIGKPSSDSLSFLGLLLLIFSFWIISPATPWPSWYTILPCLGVVLILVFTRESSLVYRLLSLKPMVFIGILSYSLYLWHQPILAFIRADSLKHPSQTALLLGLAASFLLAWLSYRFFEKPLRYGFSQSKASSGLFVMLFLWAFLLSGVSLFYVQKGHSEQSVQINDFSPNKGLSTKCDDPDNWNGDCVRGDGDVLNIVWGDSYAMHLIDGIIASNPDVNLIQMTKSSCAPTLELANRRNTERQNDFEACLKHNHNVIEFIRENQSIVKHVVLASPFLYLSNPNFTVDFRGTEQQGSTDILMAALSSTVEELIALDIAVTIVSPPPEQSLMLDAA